MIRPCILMSFVIVLTGCRDSRKEAGRIPVQVNHSGGKVNIEYAQGFTIFRDVQGTFIYVMNPWKKTDTLATYFLSGKKGQAIPEIDFTVKVPVGKVVSLSNTYLGMFGLLGSQDKLTAATDANLIYDSVLYDRYLRGTLTDLGQYMHVSYEAIIGQNPDLVMKYIMGAPDEYDNQLIKSGIPVAYNLEFMEPHPLGRAEWLKFVAAFLGKEHEADSIFEDIEKKYLHLSAKAAEINDKPAVLDGACYKGTWHSAGGRSYPAQLYRDAGARYYWENDTSRGSLALSLEVIIQKQVESDFWMNTSSGSRSELLGIESRYALFKAFREGNVYHFGKRVNPNGGYDYYESGVVRPDLLLKDLISVFHPDITGQNYETVYLQKIR